jgi:putative hydrolase of the HAD superfamily
VALKAVTFDFWSTLVDGEITGERTAQRVARLHEAILGAGHSCSPDEVHEALRRTVDRVSEEARESLEDVGPPGRWAVLAHELGIPDGLIAYDVVAGAYEEITLDQLPEVMPHVHVALEGVRRAGYRLAVICNTGTTGGRVLREVLRRHGLFEFFETSVFSNEFGLSKPHPAIFEHALAELGGIDRSEALHVGDLEELDVEGARRAGLHAALYAPNTDGTIHTDADFVVTDWREFPRQVAEHEASRRQRRGYHKVANGSPDSN